MLDNILDLLADPHTGEPLTWADDEHRQLRTASGRRYDVARQGYVSLFAQGRAFAGDTAAMIADRAVVLDSGLYKPLREQLRFAARTAYERASHGTAPSDSPVVVDMGAGTGYYTAALQEELGARVVASDISVVAVKRLAKLPAPSGAIVADVWQRWPLQNSCCDLVTHIFAPRHLAEAARILRPGGRVLIAIPTQDHLRELVATGQALHVGESKLEQIAAQAEGLFTLEESSVCSWQIDADAATAQRIIGMGPSAYHRTPTTTAEHSTTSTGMGDDGAPSAGARPLEASPRTLSGSVHILCYARNAA